jgi:hypothetical protein
MSFLKKNYKIILFTFLIILVFYRSPYIFLNGRFVAEEGSFWFRNAYLFGPIKGLTQILWGTNYFNLWANISSVLASLVNIKFAPFITVYMSALVIIFLLLYIIYSESDFIQTIKDRIVISLAVLLSPAISSSVWLNTLVSQVYLSLIVILIYFQKDKSKNFFNRFSPVVVFIATMSSLIPCILLPFFYKKYRSFKSKLNFSVFILMLVGTIFQLFIFLYSKFTGIEKLTQDGIRFLISEEKIINFFYNVILKPFLGRDLTQILYYEIFNKYYFVLSIFLLSFSYIFLKKIIVIIKKDIILQSLLIFFVLESIFAIVGSKGDQVQGRYAVVPSTLIILFVYRLSLLAKSNIKFISNFLIVLCLVIGFTEYKFNNKYPQFLKCINCPEWKNEIIKWQDDKSYQIKIWQYPQKTMDLDISRAY